jgi:glycine cleavage system transcriptional repressor
MKQWFALSAIGGDRPGIVADLAELIYECDCNLEDSSMTILGSEFAVLLLLTGEATGVAEHLSAACKRLEWEKRLTVFFRPLEGAPVPFGARHHAQRFELQAVGVDKAGIVARVARCLAAREINIFEMRTQSRPEPGSGSPIYTMQIQMDVPGDTDIAALRRDVDRLAGELNIDITLVSRES